MRSGLVVLQLQDNRLTGSLPPSWSSIEQLRQLLLQGNQLQGQIPTSWPLGMSNLQALNVSGNTPSPGVCGTNPGGASWPSDSATLINLLPCAAGPPVRPTPVPPPEGELSHTSLASFMRT